MFEKIVPAICMFCFTLYFSFIQLPQPAMPLLFRRNPLQIVTYILPKIFFKYALQKSSGKIFKIYLTRIEDSDNLMNVDISTRY